MLSRRQGRVSSSGSISGGIGPRLRFRLRLNAASVCLAFQKQDGKGAEETFRGDACGVYLDCGSDYVTLFPKLIDLNT